MAQPEDKNSNEYDDWVVRHHFTAGATSYLVSGIENGYDIDSLLCFIIFHVEKALIEGKEPKLSNFSLSMLRVLYLIKRKNRNITLKEWLEQSKAYMEKSKTKKSIKRRIK